MAEATPYETPFDSYVQIGSIGEGGAGRVYQVKGQAGIPCALKVLKNAVFRHPKTGNHVIDEQKLKRFQNEVFFCIRISHRNVVRVLDFGFVQENGLKIPFCVMPYYPKTLRKLLNEKIPPDKVLRYFAQILDGVEAAHFWEICHRDLKPENILYNPETDHMVVADFGIAHFQEELLVTQVETKVGERLANFEYAAPEQKRKGAEVDQRCDIYALGLILNEMFTGVVIQGMNPPLVGSVAPEYSYLDRIVVGMTDHRAENRCESIDRVKVDLMAQTSGIFERQRFDAFTKEVVPSDTPDDSYMLTLRRALSDDVTVSLVPSVTQSPLKEIYDSCLKAMQDRNYGELDKIRGQAVSSVSHVMNEWRKRYENNLPSSAQERYVAIDDAVISLGPLFILPLASLDSRDAEFLKSEAPMLSKLLSIPGWARSGYESIIEFPKTLGFIFQLLYGAKSIATSQPNSAFDLLTKMRIKLAEDSKPLSVWERDYVMGYPATIGTRGPEHWGYMYEASSRMAWLQELFGSTGQYQEALVAYSMALNIFELASLIAEGQVDLVLDSDNRSVPRIPTYFHFSVQAVSDPAGNLLTADGRVLEACWTYRGIGLGDIKKYWKPWIDKVQSYWSPWYPRMGFRQVPHREILP